MKKALYILMAAALITLTVVGCGKTKILHCDNCNAEVEVGAKSNMEEDWSIYCDTCNEQLFGDLIEDEG